MLLPPRALHVYRAASDDPGRHQINGVHIVKNGSVRLEATDGKILIRTEFSPLPESEFPVLDGMPPVEENEEFSAILPVESAKMAIGMPMKRSYKPILQQLRVNATKAADSSVNELTLSATDLERSDVRRVRTIEGSYPRFDTCLEKNVALPAIAEFKFDARRMRDLCDALLKIHPDTDESTVIACTVRQEPKGYCPMIEMRVSDMKEIHGVKVNTFAGLMPVKVEEPA